MSALCASPRMCALLYTLIINKIKFSSYIGDSEGKQLQSHIWLTATSFSHIRIRKPFLIYDFATASFWISLYMRKILLSFLSVFETHPGVSGGVLFFIVAIIVSVCTVKICNRRKRRKQEQGKSRNFADFPTLILDFPRFLCVATFITDNNLWIYPRVSEVSHAFCVLPGLSLITSCGFTHVYPRFSTLSVFCHVYPL